ncbi:MAG: hypothetical protein WBE76_19790 [Terracidiphilus sp.]
MRSPSSICRLAFLLAGALSATFAQGEQPKASPLTVVDPYLMTIPSNHELSASAVVDAALAGKAAARGIVADDTTAAIVVYKASSSKAVTFSATNGAKVAKYTPGFLTADSGAGTTSLAITPTKIGTAYYALALMTTGTAPDAEHGADATISAVSAGGSARATYSLLTIPTPVVLIHGLWGSILSLASTEGYLRATAAFSPYRFLVTPICYSDYLGFDAETDTLPGHGTRCEFTSAQSLDKYFSSTLFPQLDEDHYVGGRVDVVAHSMGGLAVRHFADIPGYKSVRNRYLGAFRNVVTLDTPETGSALSTYLDDVAYNRTLQVTNPFSAAFLLWTNFCGASSTTTVEECFDANSLPLSYPGTALDTGAVWSLIPGGRSIASAPPADTFNTRHGRWFAVASDYKDGDQPPSLLRDVLNTVIAATYAQAPPTVDSILGSASNDVVVTVGSQTAAAPTAQSKEFKDLQHTPAPGEAKLLFGGDSNASVTDSAEVNGQVAYWLGLQKTSAPAAARDIESEIGSEQISGGSVQGPTGVRATFLAPDRLTASIPDRPVGLGQPVRIPLHLAGPSVVDIAVDQSGVSGSLRNESKGVPVGSGRAKILSQDDGTTTIEVTPLALGSLTLRVSVLFADGGLATRDLRLNVVPSAQGLASFDLNKGFKVLALVLDDREQDRQAYLFPEVQFKRLRDPVYLDDSSQLHLAVDQPEDDAVIRVDPNGLVHAVRPGTAIINGNFDGVRDSIKVIVLSQEDAPPGYGGLDD